MQVGDILIYNNITHTKYIVIDVQDTYIKTVIEGRGFYTIYSLRNWQVIDTKDLTEMDVQKLKVAALKYIFQNKLEQYKQDKNSLHETRREYYRALNNYVYEKQKLREMRKQS